MPRIVENSDTFVFLVCQKMKLEKNKNVYGYDLCCLVGVKAGGLCQLLRIDHNYVTPEEQRHANAVVRVAKCTWSKSSMPYPLRKTPLDGGVVGGRETSLGSVS
jgi:hypothetical protein